MDAVIKMEAGTRGAVYIIICENMILAFSTLLSIIRKQTGGMVNVSGWK